MPVCDIPKNETIINVLFLQKDTITHNHKLWEDSSLNEFSLPMLNNSKYSNLINEQYDLVVNDKNDDQGSAILSKPFPIFRAYTDILTYEKLEDDWDGYNGSKFNSQVITLSKEILENFEAYCYINNIDFEKIKITTGPAGDGSIDIKIDHLDNVKRTLFILIEDTGDLTIDYSGSGSSEPKVLKTTHLEKYFHWLFNEKITIETVEKELNGPDITQTFSKV